jgi:hypothetical protein
MKEAPRNREGLMSRILRWFVATRPGWLFGIFWVIVLLGLFRFGAEQNKVLSDIFSLLCGIVLVGCPLVVLLGLPRRFVGRWTLRISIACGVVDCFLLLLALLAIFIPSMTDDSASGTALQWLGSVVVISAFLPFFLATHVVDEASRSVRIYKPLDFIPTFLSIYAFVFGGVFYLHKRLRIILEKVGEGDARDGQTP